MVNNISIPGPSRSEGQPRHPVEGVDPLVDDVGHLVDVGPIVPVVPLGVQLLGCLPLLFDPCVVLQVNILQKFLMWFSTF